MISNALKFLVSPFIAFDSNIWIKQEYMQLRLLCVILTVTPTSIWKWIINLSSQSDKDLIILCPHLTLQDNLNQVTTCNKTDTSD